VFPAEDGHFILAVGNDAQFLRFCHFAGAAELAEDNRFSTNVGRVRNRDELIPKLEALTTLKTVEQWVEGLERLGVPCGPVNRIDQVFSDPQVTHRGMRISLPYADCKGDSVDLIGSPIRMSETPVSYRRAPPRLGQDAEEILRDVLGYDAARIRELKESGTAAITMGR
jgi:crotonobetainyl-CoA:carnitine CoA-transferase CaiB-like acyl-CoA transferase